MLLSVFQKNEKKDYLKRIGVKFSKDEKQEIKKMIKSNLTLEQCKYCRKDLKIAWMIANGKNL